jgi:hypothetical protein
VTAAKNTGWKITTRTRSFVCEEEFLWASWYLLQSQWNLFGGPSCSVCLQHIAASLVVYRPKTHRQWLARWVRNRKLAGSSHWLVSDHIICHVTNCFAGVSISDKLPLASVVVGVKRWPNQ